MSWHTGVLYAYDCESTGVDVENDRIVTATLVRIDGQNVTERNWIVNPGVEIPQGAIDVHGVTNEQAQAEGIDPATAVAQILADLDGAWTGGRPVVIYNASFDLSILDRELRRHTGQNLDGVIGAVVDPIVVDKHLDKYRKGSRTLAATCAHYDVRLEGAHTSAGDALAAARLAWRLATVYGTQIGDLTTLNDLQATWRKAWADSFRQFLQAKGEPADDVRGEWPMVPVAS